MWPEIIAQQPDLYVLGGDNVYGDTEDMNKLARKYAEQKNRDTYQQLLAAMPVIGTWDDHDYGANDAGKEYPMKEQSEKLLLNFLDVPQNHPVRSYPGVYHSYTMGQEGQRVKVLLLDTRYFRDRLYRSEEQGRRYAPNPTGDILGEQQWAWLRAELDTTTAAVNIIVSSIQVVSEDHGWEKWANFPVAHQRLYKLLQELQPPATFIVSGDRHIGQLSRIQLPELPYPLYDLTASGLTHTWLTGKTEVNNNAVGEVITRTNYGLVRIDWKDENPTINFMLKGRRDSTHYFNSVRF
jgi:alkaline phosphatase D